MAEENPDLGSSMLELLRLLPRRPLAVSLGGWTFFFVWQVLFLTYAVYKRYVPPPEPLPLGHLWFLYTELPRALPMAAVYAACMVFVAQVMGRFISPKNPDNLTVANWYELLKTDSVKAIQWMGLRVIFLLGMAGFFVDRIVPLPSWLGLLSGVLVGGLVVHLMVTSWLDWVVEQIAPRGRENANRDGAGNAPAPRRRRGRRPRNPLTHSQQSNQPTERTCSSPDGPQEKVNEESEA